MTSPRIGHDDVVSAIDGAYGAGAMACFSANDLGLLVLDVLALADEPRWRYVTLAQVAAEHARRVGGRPNLESYVGCLRAQEVRRVLGIG